jgi:hypothetical protein
MKKYIFFFVFYLSISSAFASFFCHHTINVNNNFSIMIQFQDWQKSDVTAGLYFDLTVWSKNVGNAAANVYGDVYIDYFRDNTILMWISKSDTAEIAYRFFYDTKNRGVKIIEYTNVNTGYPKDFIITDEHFLKGSKDLTKAIVAQLNANFNTTARHDNLDSVELFVKNNKENAAKQNTANGKIRSDYIYVNKEGIKEDGYFVEPIIIRRNEVDMMVEVDSEGCG